MKEAMILAGGMGTRLREAVPDLPKPMADINGKPFLYFVLQWLEKYSFSRVIISSGYKADIIKAYFGDSFNKISLAYSIEDKPLGTGGAVRFSLDQLYGNEVLIINGDTWFPIDLNRFCSFHAEAASQFSVALKRMENFSRYGSVEFENDTIIRFNEKKFCSEGYINGGIYLTSRHFIESKAYSEVFSLETDMLEKETSTGVLKCQVFDDPFIDIGIPEDYIQARKILKSCYDTPDK